MAKSKEYIFAGKLAPLTVRKYYFQLFVSPFRIHRTSCPPIYLAPSCRLGGLQVGPYSNFSDSFKRESSEVCYPLATAKQQQKITHLGDAPLLCV